MQLPERRIESTAEAEGAAYEAPALRLLRAVERQRRARVWLWQGLRVLGALSLLAVGAAHLQQYLLVSERTPLFGFMEPGYDPPAIMATRVAKLATVGLLGSFLVARLATRARRGRW